MRPRLGDFPVADHEDPVGDHRRSKPVRDEKRRFPGRHLRKFAIKTRFGNRIELRSRLIQKQDRLIAHEGAGNRDSLPFTAGEINAAGKSRPKSVS